MEFFFDYSELLDSFVNVWCYRMNDEEDDILYKIIMNSILLKRKLNSVVNF